MNNYTQQRIDQNDLQAVTFLPKLTNPSPAILLISGSEGGIPVYIAQKLQETGLPIMALSYFGEKNQPEFLQNIPLEYFEKAFYFFSSYSEVDQNKIHLVGNSRGGELALILGAYYPHLFCSISAFVPSCYVHGGFPFPNQEAWTIEGKAISPFIGAASSEKKEISESEDYNQSCCSLGAGSESQPYCLTDLFEKRLKKHKDSLEDCMIPFWKIKKPLLLLTGEKDEIWPSSYFARVILKKMESLAKENQLTHQEYLGAGHGLAFPYFKDYDKPMLHPKGLFWCSAGGQPIENEYASQESLKELKKFLSRT